MLGKILSFLGGGIVDSVKGVVTAVAGDQAKRDEQAATDLTELRKQFGAEFRTPTTWWDSLVDGLNRLPRPLMTFGTIGLFAWCAADPVTFAASMTAMALIPENLWIILGTIVVFWFGGKALEGVKASKVNASAVREVVSTVAEIKAMADKTPSQTPAAPPPVEPIAPDQYDREMADTSKALSLPAIVEWNKRRGNS